MAYCDGLSNNGEVFTVGLAYFNCSNIVNGEFPATGLGTQSFAYLDADLAYVCFDKSFAIPDILAPCDTLFILGFNTTNLIADSNVKVTYTFSVLRNCTS